LTSTHAPNPAHLKALIETEVEEDGRRLQRALAAPNRAARFFVAAAPRIVPADVMRSDEHIRRLGEGYCSDLCLRSTAIALAFSVSR
jgi:hypothetical protein